MQSDDESDNGSAASGAGPTRVKEPTFGAQFMIFRVLLVAGAAVSFAAGEGNQAAILATAAAAGAVWSRCGRDGRDGASYKASHFADSRVHRVAREVFLHKSLTLNTHTHTRTSGKCVKTLPPGLGRPLPPRRSRARSPGRARRHAAAAAAAAPPRRRHRAATAPHVARATPPRGSECRAAA